MTSLDVGILIVRGQKFVVFKIPRIQDHGVRNEAMGSVEFVVNTLESGMNGIETITMKTLHRPVWQRQT